MSEQPKTAMAVTSLVLGILAPFTCGMTAAPAILLGHIAHTRASKFPDNHGGRRMAIAGFVFGYIGVVSMFIVIPFVAAKVFPVLSSAKGRMQWAQCVVNVQQISVAAREYGLTNESFLPETFRDVQGHLSSPRLLVCPGAIKKMPQNANWARFDWSKVSYEIVSPGASLQESSNLYVRCPIHLHEVFADGRVHHGPETPGSQEEHPR